MRGSIFTTIVIIFIFILNIFVLFSNILVKQVSAGCSGTIQCGSMAYRCSLSKEPCSTLNAPCGIAGSGGTCQWLCDITLEPSMDCAGYTVPLSEALCNSVTAPKDCNEGCNTSAETPCNWSNATAPPTDPLCYTGTCKASCSESEQGYGTCSLGYCCGPVVAVCRSSGAITDPGVDCGRTGFYGQTTADGKLVATGYSCNPRSDPLGGTVCSTWENTFDGYLDIPEEGNYEFNITYSPIMSIQIDVNNNGVFDQVCPNYNSGHYLGDVFFWLSSHGMPSARPPWIRDWGFSPTAACGSCWEDFPLRIPCGEGRHNENADYNTYNRDLLGCSATGPLTLDPSDIGPSECPIAVYNENVTYGGDEEDIKWSRNGLAYSYFTRYLQQGSVLLNIKFRGRSNSTNSSTLKYRKVGDLNWIDLSSPPGGICPVKPCLGGTCTVDLVPNSATIPQGGTTEFSALVVPQDGIISRVDFNSNDTNIATITPPASLTTAPYNVSINGVNTGSTSITANAIMNGSICDTDTSIVNVAHSGPWWQAQDGDITTNGNITSKVPGASYLNIIGLGGYPGVPVYGGSLSFTPGLLSTTNWNANTTTTQGRLFNYSYFEDLIPDEVNDSYLNDISILASGVGALTFDGYEWYKTSADLAVSSNINFGSRKVILFVEGSNLNIDARINLTDGVGFFGAFVEGNINVNATVTGGVGPAMEGIYLTNGSFNTGLGNTQLHTRGSIASFGGLNLQRDLSDNSSPAELFEYGPDQVLLFPSKLAFRRIKWVEVAP